MVEKFDIVITPLGLERTIHVYLPEDYYDSDEQYPVMYMFDGHNLFYSGGRKAVCPYFRCF